MTVTDRGQMLSVALMGLVTLGAMLINPSLQNQVAMLFLFVLSVPLMIFGRRPFTILIQADAFTWSALLKIADSLFLLAGVVTIASMIMGHPSCGRIGIAVAALALWFNALALVITFHLKRRQAPLMAWSLYVLGAALTFILPIVLILAVGRHEGTAWPPAWLTSPPLIYLYLLPCVGIVCEILDHHSPQRFLGHRSTVVAFLATAWFAVFTAVGRGVFFVENDTLWALLDLFTLVPLTIILLNMIATLAYGRWSLQAPFLYALVFLGVFTTGHCSGLFLTIPGLGNYLQGTWWAQAHFSWLMAGGTGIAYLAGFYSWWAEMGGSEMYSESWTRCSLLVLVGTLMMSVFPTLVLGAMGIPMDVAAPTSFISALRVFSTETALFLLAGYVIALSNLIVHAGKLRQLALLGVLLCMTSAGSAVTSTSTVSTPALPEDLGPAVIDVSSYPPEHQKTYQDVFLSFARYAGGPARLINSPLVELDSQSELLERKANPALFSEPGIVEVSPTAWKTYVSKIRSRPPCCGACPFLTLTQARDLWSFLVYDSRLRKTGPRAAGWIYHRRQLMKEFNKKEPQS